MTYKRLLCMAALCAACGTDDAVTPGDGSGTPNGDGGSPSVDGGSNNRDGGLLGSDGGPAVGTAGCGKMDLLFVIDNSGSMSEEQENLASNFPRVIGVLDALKGGGIDYRVGVTTTSIGAALAGIPFLMSTSENGALLQTNDMQQPWLSRGEPNLAERFTALATVGTSGSGKEQPLRAALAAVSEPLTTGSNAGFLRPDALTAIVVLTDEDDSSSAPEMLDPVLMLFPVPGSELPVADFVKGFDSARGGRGNWASAVIAGDKMEGCESAFGEANYGERLVDFVSQTGPNAVLGSICQGDLAGELDKALNVFASACETFVPLF
jgi:hypothetical protein